MTAGAGESSAYAPGGRDRQGRPVLTAWVGGPGDNLGAALRGVAAVFGADTRAVGLCVLLDGRRCPWRVARAAIRVARQALGPDLGRLIVLRPEAFWENQRVDCTKVPKEGEVSLKTTEDNLNVLI